MKQLMRCVYVSRATIRFRSDGLDELARKSAFLNSRNGVTGLLLFSAGNFMQCFEGPTDVVAAVYTKISADSRHRELNTLLFEPAESRLFGKWAMGGLDLNVLGNAIDVARLERVLAVVRRAGPDAPDAALTLLKDFRAQLPGSFAVH